MQVPEAISLLGVPEPLRAENIRRCYRRAALKCHPDKGGCANEFHRVCEAHDTLQREVGAPDQAEVRYTELMNDFLATALGTSYDSANGGSLFVLFSKVASGCKTALGALASLRDLEPQTCLSALNFLEKHASVLHIDITAVRAAREVFHQKQEGRPKFSYTLNATLDHILEPDVFKLRHRDEELMVPLWHEDLVFDTSGGIVCVRCTPALPPHMAIDEHDNLRIDITMNPESILATGFLTVPLGTGAPVRVPGRDIKMVPEQNIVRRGIGIPLINLKDVYATDRRGDIIIHLKLSPLHT